MVQLTDDLIVLLDREAARRGVSRSALIRSVLEEFIAADREAEISRQIIEGYKRIPQGTPDEWGDLAAQTEAAHKHVLAKLDAEERAAGFGPWRKKEKRGGRTR